MEKDELYKVLSDIRSKIQNELLTPIFDEFISNITSNDVLHITSKLIKYKCLKYTRKRDIMENCLTTIEKADKLFDFVYNSDIIVIYRFIEEVKVLLPHVYRIIETADEKLKSEYTSYVNFDVAFNKINIEKNASEKSENILTEISNNNQIELLIEKIENLNTLVPEQSKTIKRLEEEIRSIYTKSIYIDMITEDEQHFLAKKIKTSKEGKIKSKSSFQNSLSKFKKIFSKRKNVYTTGNPSNDIEHYDDIAPYYSNFSNTENKPIKEIDADSSHYITMEDALYDDASYTYF